MIFNKIFKLMMNTEFIIAYLFNGDFLLAEQKLF